MIANLCVKFKEAVPSSYFKRATWSKPFRSRALFGKKQHAITFHRIELEQKGKVRCTRLSTGRNLSYQPSLYDHAFSSWFWKSHPKSAILSSVTYIYRARAYSPWCYQGLVRLRALHNQKCTTHSSILKIEKSIFVDSILNGEGWNLTYLLSLSQLSPNDRFRSKRITTSRYMATTPYQPREFRCRKSKNCCHLPASHSTSLEKHSNSSFLQSPALSHDQKS